jgi:nicotinamide-nucleotide amidase
MKIEVINTGTELLLGNVVNTHLAFLGQELFPLGLRIDRQVCVPDGPAIREALIDAFPRADIVIITGGLGPTSDDLTRDIAAELLGRALEVDPDALAALTNYFGRLGRQIDARISRQAQVPAGAVVIHNAHGTAPGLYLPAAPLGAGQSPHLFLLPGPPRELRPMFVNQVAPMLEKLLPADAPRPGCRIYRTVGLGESVIEAMVGPALEAIEGLEIGYCARIGEVDVRCIGSAELLERAEAVIVPALGASILSREGESLDGVLVRLLIARKQTLAVAESCTGGLLSSRITDVPGCSAMFLAGLTVYANSAKAAVLGVDPGLIERCGAVSEEVAAAMATGVRRVTGADFALTTTGIAGPDGGTEAKPVGTVFIALEGPDGQPPTVERHFYLTDRETFKRRASQAALDLLRRALTAQASARNED